LHLSPAMCGLASRSRAFWPPFGASSGIPDAERILVWWQEHEADVFGFWAKLSHAVQASFVNPVSIERSSFRRSPVLRAKSMMNEGSSTGLVILWRTGCHLCSSGSR